MNNNKIYAYIVVIKQKNRKAVELLGLCSGAIFLIPLFIKAFENPERALVYIGIGIASFGLMANNFLLFRKGKKIKMTPVFLMAAVTLLFIPTLQWLSVLYVLLSIVEKYAFQQEEIGFNPDEIYLSRLFPKKINWSALNNVVLKDGLITLDFKSNSIMQFETDILDEEEDDEVTEEEFNAFCQLYLPSDT